MSLYFFQRQSSCPIADFGTHIPVGSLESMSKLQKQAKIPKIIVVAWVWYFLLVTTDIINNFPARFYCGMIFQCTLSFSKCLHSLQFREQLLALGRAQKHKENLAGGRIGPMCPTLIYIYIYIYIYIQYIFARYNSKCVPRPSSCICPSSTHS